MSFAFTSRLIAWIFAILFAILCFFPAAYAPTYGVAASEGVQFLTRRASPMFIGTAVILWVAATAPRSALRDAVALGVAAMCIGIAVTGVVAWGQGAASPAILVAALLECLMAAALWVTRKN